MTTPINVITVACDPKHMATVRVTCRCAHSWIERVPHEIHEALHMACIFECPRCHQEYVLHHKVLTRHYSESSALKEGGHDRYNQQQNSDIEYDA